MEELADYVFHDFSDEQKIVVKMKADTGVLRFPVKMRNIIRKKKLTHMRVREDRLSGDIHLVFNKGVGMEIKGINDTTSMRISNKKCATWIKTMLDSDFFFLSEDLSNSDDFATFKILTKN